MIEFFEAAAGLAYLAVFTWAGLLALYSHDQQYRAQR